MSKVKMYGYKVIIDQHCDDSYQSPEQWGEWHSSHTNTFSSISKDNSEYPDVVSTEDIKDGQNCFVIWAEWSSGDSFGHGDRSNVEALAVFSQSKDAFDMKNALKKPMDGYSYDFTASTGQNFHSDFAGWSGYFESLDDIHVSPTIMMNNQPSIES